MCPKWEAHTRRVWSVRVSDRTASTEQQELRVDQRAGNKGALLFLYPIKQNSGTYEMRCKTPFHHSLLEIQDAWPFRSHKEKQIIETSGFGGSEITTLFAFFRRRGVGPSLPPNLLIPLLEICTVGLTQNALSPTSPRMAKSWEQRQKGKQIMQNQLTTANCTVMKNEDRGKRGRKCMQKSKIQERKKNSFKL